LNACLALSSLILDASIARIESNASNVKKVIMLTVLNARSAQNCSVIRLSLVILEVLLLVLTSGLSRTVSALTASMLKDVPLANVTQEVAMNANLVFSSKRVDVILVHQLSQAVLNAIAEQIARNALVISWMFKMDCALARVLENS